jgi:SAM-dependent methyltransferase
MTAAGLFDFLDQLRKDRFPTNWSELFQQRLDDFSQMSRVYEKNFETEMPRLGDWEEQPSENDFATRTGRVYAQLWKGFDAGEYFDNAFRLLEQRFQNNGISLEGVVESLDDGCGGGRYSIALRRLGAARVRGIDVSREAVSLAKQRNPYPEEEVSFHCGSVLDLPFEDGRFDFVFSNGVLHHTESTEQGLAEIHRVTKPGGRVWLYLYGGKESFFWDTVDFCRRILSGIPQAYTQAVMNVMGYPAGRIMHRCDFFYVPVHRRYFAAEVEDLLHDAGFADFRRLERGAGIDWDEIRYHNPQIDPYIYGEGEMRYLINKDE